MATEEKEKKETPAKKKTSGTKKTTAKKTTKKQETAKDEKENAVEEAKEKKTTAKKSTAKSASTTKKDKEESKAAASKDASKEVKAKADEKETKAKATAEAEVKDEAKEDIKAEDKEKATKKAEDKKEAKEDKAEQAAAPAAEKKKDSSGNGSAPKSEKEILDFDEPTEEFDWEDLGNKGFGEEYSEDKLEELSESYSESLRSINEKEVVTGTVVGINDRDVILNIGFKSDGLVNANEFRDLPELKIGDQVEVYVEEQENRLGQLVLSRRKAKIVNAWEKIQDAYENDNVIEGYVKRRTKGGLIVDIYGVESFLPGSQIDVKPIRDFDVFVDKKMEVKVVKINYSNDNVVVSHKVLIEKDLEAQKAEILNNLEKGQVLEGVIKNMTNFGVFIDLGGVDGLLHITDISWGRVNHPEEVLNLDDTVKVVVLDFDEDKKRISLGMKQLTEHPWDSLDEKIEVGSKVSGKIVNVADYGAFLEIQPGVEGLIHVSEMSWSQHLRNPQDFISVGDELEAVVLTIDREERKMSLGIKQLTEDPWTKQDILTKYAIGTQHKGIVRNMTNFGLFIELEEGIDGLVHVSDLSWTRKVKHPSEFTKVGEELEVQVLELDVENRRLALGHKQLEENPWDTFETVFEPGTVHKCTVISLNDKGAVLELPYGIEGFCSSRNLAKEDGSKAEVGESLDFKVLDFSKEEKRVALSHQHVWKNIEEKHKPRKTSGGKSSGGRKQQKHQGEATTLGDLEALSALKDKMESDEKSTPKKKSTKKASKKKEEESDEE